MTGKTIKAGFTLIELLVVVAIVGILAAITIPLYSIYRCKAYDTVAVTDIKVARITIEAFLTEYQKYPY